jgi:hypothetical protein
MKNSNAIMESFLRPRKIQVYSETLDVYQDGKVFHGTKLVLDLEENVKSKSEDELQGELETLLYYDYQDNKE